MNLIEKVKIVICPEYSSWIDSDLISVPNFPPLGIAQITAYLREKGLKVDQDDLDVKFYHENYNREQRLDLSKKFRDVNFKEYLTNQNPEDFLDFIEGFCKKSDFENCDIICLAAFWQDDPVNFHIMLALAKYLKERFNVPIVLGGSITFYRVDYFDEILMLAHKQGVFDYMIMGCGEVALYRLIDGLNGNQTIEDIPGIYYGKEQKFQNVSLGEVVSHMPDFDGLPLDLYGTSMRELYFEMYGKKRKRNLILPVQFIRGCSKTCIFCPSSEEKRVFITKPQEVVQTLKELRYKCDTKYFFFFSNMINISKTYVNELCDEILKQKLDILWSDCAIFNDLDMKTLKKMRKAGCIRLIYGLETGSERMLKYIQKGVTLEQASEVLRLSSRAGIWTGLEIIAGMPTETEKDVDETINFLKTNSSYCDTVYLNPFFLAEGSLLKAMPEKYGIENIRRIEDYRADDEDYMTRAQMYAYDEMNGLRWEDKKKQINNSYRRVFNYIKEQPFWGSYDEFELTYLFLAYEKFRKKKSVKKNKEQGIRFLIERLKN